MSSSDCWRLFRRSWTVARQYQVSLIVTHRDVLPGLPVRSGSRGDAGAS
jgi:hypothetical protein